MEKGWRVRKMADGYPEDHYSKVVRWVWIGQQQWFYKLVYDYTPKHVRAAIMLGGANPATVARVVGNAISAAKCHGSWPESDGTKRRCWEAACSVLGEDADAYIRVASR